ncbi:THAP domain-containing protein 1-like [Ochlerotatus camptorhynchus]|uniref:THAP domain-containing protein 1-like n=1 Tax=Ochlerotatus camptorhynchus TaxID=644619 RepID=UPI0031D71A34
MYKCCAVFSCANSTSRSRKSMYKFPTDAPICEKWVEFCKSDKINDMLVLEGVYKLRNSSFSVCADHFEKRCFVNPNNTSQGIYKGSIPTIIAGHPVLVSNFKKANQIPDFFDLDAQHRRSPEPCEEEMPVEVLYEELENAIAPAEPIISTDVETATQPNAQPTIDPHVFACQCTKEFEYRTKFFEERTRAVGLVQEIKATASKLRAVKQPVRRKTRSVRRINESIRKIKAKIIALAEEYHTVIELSSDDDSGED